MSHHVDFRAGQRVSVEGHVVDTMNIYEKYRFGYGSGGFPVGSQKGQDAYYSNT